MAIYEAKHIKGQEYKKLSTTTNVYSGSSDGAETYGTTSTGNGGVLDSVAQNHIEDLDIEKEKSLIESKDLINEYSLYIQGNINKAIQEYGDQSKSQLEKRMVEDLSMLQNYMELDANTSTQLIIDEYYGGKFLTKFLGNSTEPSAEDIEKCSTAIKTILRLRMNYVNKITSLLSKMLKINYKQLGLSEEQAEIYINSLKSNSNDSVKTAGKIKQLIKDNADKYMKNGGESIDLSPLGFGVILGPAGKYQIRSAGTDSTNKDAMLKFIQQAMRYDVVVIAHGEDGYTSQKLKKSGKDIKHTLDQSVSEVWQNSKNYIGQKSSEIVNDYDDNEAISYIINFYSSFIKSINLKKYLKYDIEKLVDVFEKNDDIADIEKYIVEFLNQKAQEILKTFDSANTNIKRNKEKYTEDVQNIIEKDKSKLKELYELIALDVLLGEDVSGGYVGSLIKHIKVQTTIGIWGCQPTRTLKAGPFTDVNELVRELIKEGYKKILIEDCNPGDHQLTEDIMKTKGVLINHSNFSNYFESSLINSNDPTYISINEAEMSLKTFANSYDINYNDDKYLEECCNWYDYNYNAIQEGKITGAIKDFFKRIVGAIVGFFKNIINLIKTAFHKLRVKFSGTKEEPKDVESKFQKQIETPLINIKNQKIEKTSSYNRTELQKVADEMCSQISNEIKKINQKQQSSLKNIEKDIDKLQDKENTIHKYESTNHSNDYLLDIFLENNVDIDLLDIINEFEAGNNQDDDTDDYSMDDEENNQDNTQQNNQEENTDQQNNDDNQQDDDADDYSIDDEGDQEETQQIDQTENPDTQNNDDNQQDDDTDEYSMGGDENNQDNNQQGQQNDNQDETQDDYELPDDDEESGDNYSMDDQNDNQNETQDDQNDSENNDLDNDENSDTETNSKLKELESVIFDDLSEDEKKMKIKDLKELYISVYKKCGAILELITDVKRDEETIQIIEYISNTLIDLKQYVIDYINNVFDNKTYIENLSQLQKYIMIFNAINKVFDQIRQENNQ